MLLSNLKIKQLKAFIVLKLIYPYVKQRSCMLRKISEILLPGYCYLLKIGLYNFNYKYKATVTQDDDTRFRDAVLLSAEDCGGPWDPTTVFRINSILSRQMILTGIIHTPLLLTHTHTPTPTHPHGAHTQNSNRPSRFLANYHNLNFWVEVREKMFLCFVLFCFVCFHVFWKII